MLLFYSLQRCHRAFPMHHGMYNVTNSYNKDWEIPTHPAKPKNLLYYNLRWNALAWYIHITVYIQPYASPSSSTSLIGQHHHNNKMGIIVIILYHYRYRYHYHYHDDIIVILAVVFVVIRWWKTWKKGGSKDIYHSSSSFCQHRSLYPLLMVKSRNIVWITQFPCHDSAATVPMWYVLTKVRLKSYTPGQILNSILVNTDFQTWNLTKVISEKLCYLPDTGFHLLIQATRLLFVNKSREPKKNWQYKTEYISPRYNISQTSTHGSCFIVLH